MIQDQGRWQPPSTLLQLLVQRDCTTALQSGKEDPAVCDDNSQPLSMWSKHAVNNLNMLCPAVCV